MDTVLNSRQHQLACLNSYLKDVDNEVTMLLQNLQWDRKNLAEKKNMVVCQYDKGHRVPPDKLMEHEAKCFLKIQGYSEGDLLLPSPIKPGASTLIKLILIGSFGGDKNEGAGCSGHQPLTLERLQATYTADERRAIYDAVVSKAPSCHNLSDLALLSSKDTDGTESKAKSKLEILAELRDMRRRRTKYRVAAKTRNYSDVLRDVITTQMELYTHAHNSMSHADNSDTYSTSKANNSSNENNVTRDCAFTPDRNYNSKVGERPSAAKDDISQSFKQNKEYESRKRKYDESDYNCYSSFVSSKRDHHREHYGSKSKRRDDENYSSKSHKESRRRHDWYDSRDKYREGNCRTAQQSLNTKKYKTKDSHYVDSKYEGAYHTTEQSPNRRRRDYDKQESRKSTKRMDVDNRQKRYKQTQDKVKIKKEKEDYFDDDHSTSTVDNETNKSYHETHSGSKKIKEEDIYFKNERTTAGDNCTTDNRSQSSDTFNKKIQSEKVHDRYDYIVSSKDKHEYYEKKKDRTNFMDIEQQEEINNVKLEKDIIYEKPLGRDQDSRVADDRYKNKNGRYKVRDHEYRRDKGKERQKVHKTY